MKRFSMSPMMPSMCCVSWLVPRVVVTSAWVSPRVNSDEPCVRGSTPTSLVICRMSVGARPSIRRPVFSTSSRRCFFLADSNASETSGARSGNSSRSAALVSPPAASSAA